ncbi:hypothetical protein pb186bvf_014445 [Paramecium bursaria]
MNILRIKFIFNKLSRINRNQDIFIRKLENLENKFSLQNHKNLQGRYISLLIVLNILILIPIYEQKAMIQKKNIWKGNWLLKILGFLIIPQQLSFSTLLYEILKIEDNIEKSIQTCTNYNNSRFQNDIIICYFRIPIYLQSILSTQKFINKPLKIKINSSPNNHEQLQSLYNINILTFISNSQYQLLRLQQYFKHYKRRHEGVIHLKKNINSQQK